MISIRHRLLIWVVGGVLLFSLTASAIVLLQSRNEAIGLLDYQLKQIAVAISLNPADAIRNWSRRAVDVNEDYSVTVWDREGRQIFTGALAPQVTMPNAGYQTIQLPDGVWRLYTKVTDAGTVSVAQSEQSQWNISIENALSLLWPLLLLVPILGLATALSIRHATAPLTSLAVRISSRDAGNLTPIELGPEQTPPEIRPLVSALNHLMERLDDSLKKQRQFVSDAAHELRTPLTAISLQLQSIQSAATLEDRAERLTLLRGGIDRANHLVAQLLSLARAENGPAVNPHSATAEIIRLDQLITETLSNFLPLAECKQIDLGILSITPLQILGDPDSLRAMIGNLIDNAIRYAPGGTSIDISLTQDGESAHLIVQDQGPGLCETIQQRIFDRFYRGPANGPGLEAAGTGIGLAIVKAAVERHCGQINLRNRNNGPGLIVTIAFNIPALSAA